MPRQPIRSLSVIICTTFALPALAHQGLHTADGFISGLIHPLVGLDHFIVMLAIGFWAVQIGGKAIWTLPTVFLGCMGFGALITAAGYQVPMTESVILASVVALVLLTAFAPRLPVAIGAVLVGAFAICHGSAHLAEMSAGAETARYFAGFLSTTAALHLAGMALAVTLMQPLGRPVRTVASVQR